MNQHPIQVVPRTVKRQDIKPSNVLIRGQSVPKQLEAIEKAVLAFSQLTHAEIHSKCREICVVRPRQVHCYLCHKLTAANWRQIAEFFGMNKDSVRYGAATVQSSMEAYPLTVGKEMAELEILARAALAKL